jgi:type II secretory ATPase GspE/PulE/Tfp pilus assembly ATPase PilB-like protein
MKDMEMKEFMSQHIKLYSGKGCKECGGSGYKGRIGIYEIIAMNDTIREIIKRGGTPEEVIKV